MRSEHHVGSLEAGMDERLVFIYIKSGPGDFLALESRDECGLIDHRTTRVLMRNAVGFMR